MSLPATVWRNKGGEFGIAGPYLLADTSGKLLVDSSGANLIDSGIVIISTPATIWAKNDGV
jgi:hypothetical protein